MGEEMSQPPPSDKPVLYSQKRQKTLQASFCVVADAGLEPAT